MKKLILVLAGNFLTHLAASHHTSQEETTPSGFAIHFFVERNFLFLFGFGRMRIHPYN